ncbi:hypothetical protein HPB48_000265 [Haemaphysalis longicornis]|uniref:Uncharacterized protein n=1 Tax=Haemaphysalis longicornis TaxID=44386 RepID=A0A9J6FRW4_HAELO|nr:hypothetical protein HPB48_000265 [Haemaphysalis longicornis]
MLFQLSDFAWNWNLALVQRCHPSQQEIHITGWVEIGLSEGSRPGQSLEEHYCEGVDVATGVPSGGPSGSRRSSGARHKSPARGRFGTTSLFQSLFSYRSLLQKTDPHGKCSVLPKTGYAEKRDQAGPCRAQSD